MADFFPLHLHSHYSLLDGLSKPEAIAHRVRACGYQGAALTDHGTLSGIPSLIKAMQGACSCGHQKNAHDDGGKGRCHKKGCTCPCFEKSPLKTILGCEFYLCRQDAAIRSPENRSLSHLCVLARNAEGWKNLIQASGATNRPEHFYYKPRLDLEKLASFGKGQFIAFSGHMGSDLANICFAEPKLAYRCRTYEEARLQVRDDWRKQVFDLAGKYQELFGKGNFWLEIQLIDAKNLPAAQVVANILRYVSKQTGIPCVATADSHYPAQEDAEDQRVLLCSAFDTSFRQVQEKIDNQEDVTLGGFFKSKRYHIPSYDEMAELHTPEEMHASVAIAEQCEAYDILGKPKLPRFECPDGLSEPDYIRKLCQAGWQRKVAGQVDQAKHDEYRDRLERELGVITKAGLEGYFLVVQDYCQWVLNQGRMVGRARGSAGGCFVSHLLGITDMDPIANKLIFERFYNDGRNSPGRVALPDIDCDFEKFFRERVIDYIRDKYGHERVAQMVTFNRMQGRGALKDVLRAKERCSHEEMNKITSAIPDESAIADELQEMREETGEASIIRWALENNAEGLKEWCSLNSEGEPEGPLALDFAQAMRLEGTKRSSSRHPSGLIIASEDLSSIAPMTYDKGTNRMIVGFEMFDAEAIGLVKFDILGTAVLDRVRAAVHLRKTGKMPDL